MHCIKILIRCSELAIARIKLKKLRIDIHLKPLHFQANRIILSPPDPDVWAVGLITCWALLAAGTLLISLENNYFENMTKFQISTDFKVAWIFDWPVGTCLLCLMVNPALNIFIHAMHSFLWKFFLWIDYFKFKFKPGVIK